jgi:hypothetical protein
MPGQCINVYSTPVKVEPMPGVTLNEFRSTLKISKTPAMGSLTQIYSYWNNESATPTFCDQEETLHIIRMSDGGFCLEIGNLHHYGPLEELEQKLFEWAEGEGWLLQQPTH